LPIAAAQDEGCGNRPYRSLDQGDDDKGGQITIELGGQPACRARQQQAGKQQQLGPRRSPPQL
jgi:hypothetical protein